MNPEALETVTEVPADRSIMSTPLADYSVTEGLLLVILVVLIIGLFLRLLREVF